MNIAPGNSTRGFLRRVAWRAALPWLILGVVLVIAATAVGVEIDRHVAAIETWIAGLGPWSLIAFVGLFVLASSCLVPDSVLCVTAGVLFDLQWGVAVVVVGIFIASVLQFMLSRRLMRPRIQRMLARRPALVEIERAVQRDQIRLQLLLRLTPLNPATVSYMLGAIGVGFPGFLIGCLALIPALIIQVYVGHAGRHIARLTGGSVPHSRLHDVMVMVGLAVCVIVFVVISRRARSAVAQAVANTEKASVASPVETDSH